MTLGASSAGAGRPPRRIERLCGWLAEQGLELVVVAGAEPVNHLCGYWRYFGSPPALVIERDGRRTLVVQLDEAEEARAGGFAEELASYGARGFGLVPDAMPPLAAAVAAVPALARAARLGLAAPAGSFSGQLAARLDAELVDAAATLAAIRLVKDADELERIRAAYELAWTAQAAVAERLAAGSTEIELFTAGLAAAQLAAGEPIGFTGDLLCGARTAEVCAPIRVAGRARVGAGEPVIADLVVGRRGYFGDSAETLIVGENAELAAMRDELRAIGARAGRALAPGMTGEEVYAQLAAEIAASFPGGEFPHHGGHGVGLGPYEDPHVIPGDRTPLQAGMVVALEPGVYFAGRFGARVERMYLVGADGGRELREAAHGEPRDVG